jgi:hypothetical protein
LWTKNKVKNIYRDTKKVFGHYDHLSDFSRLITFLSECSYINKYVLFKRKAEICTWGILISSLVYIPDLNIEHAFHRFFTFQHIRYYLMFPWKIECWLDNSRLLAIDRWPTVCKIHSEYLSQQKQQMTFPIITLLINMSYLKEKQKYVHEGYWFPLWYIFLT